MQHLRVGLRLLLATTAFISAPALAASVASYNVPAQPLGDALRAFAVASHQTIIFSEDVVRGKRSALLIGNFSKEEALARLLAGQNLQANTTSTGVIYIQSSGAVAALSPVPSEGQPQEVVVTGSRIKQSASDTTAPESSFTATALTDRGYTQVGQLLNDIPSITPDLAVAPYAGYPVVEGGQQFPNLFGLGPERTLTLIDGHRMVASEAGVLGSSVDTNLIPIGLLDHVDVLEAGGAAVYGSDAISGVVNYNLKKNFKGVEVDAQYGESTRGDYQQPSLRLTAGENFDDGRGNIAVDLEYSSTTPLIYNDRPSSAIGYSTVPNPTGGSPAQVPITNARFFEFNNNGVLYNFTGAFSPQASDLFLVNGSPVQFSPDGKSIVPYNAGNIQSIILASGGQGYSVNDRSTLYAGTKRFTATLVSHYDFSKSFRLSGELLYGHEEGDDPLGAGQISQILGAYPFGPQAPLYVTKSNPYLTSQELATLSAADPAFASGAPLLLSKSFNNILPSDEAVNKTDTGRALISADGDFSLWHHNLYYNVSISHAETGSSYTADAPNSANLANAFRAGVDASGNIVCRINVNGPGSAGYDPGCVPINPFSSQAISAAAEKYVVVKSGSSARNTEDDLVANVGGQLLELPAGAVDFSVGYEYRHDTSSDVPYAANQEGLIYYQSTTPLGGEYHTNEFAAELKVPIISKQLHIPLIEAVDLDGSYRYVDNSLAGKESVWGTGVRWTIGYGLTLRGTRSRNFSAPTLTEEFTPASASPGAILYDPCSKENIGAGPNPAVRLSSCQALFAQHPEYGSLSNFVDLAENQSTALITTSGNQSLKNEISNTTTVGFVWAPPKTGLSVAIDVISIDLTNGLSQLEPSDFLQLCYDAKDQAACNTFTRSSNGDVATALSTYFNAGSVKYRGETYKADYVLPLREISRGFFDGTLALGVSAAHTAKLATSTTPFETVRSDGTVAMPDWRILFDAKYTRGPLSVFYTLSGVPTQKSDYYATAETTPYVNVPGYTVSSFSVKYHFPSFDVRAGFDNIFDKGPPPEALTFGDILGRRFFVGFTARM